MSKSPTSEFHSSVGVVMIRVPAGSFTMGSPEAEDGHRAWEQQREVTFGNGFYLGKTPVTQDQFEAVTGTNMPLDCDVIRRQKRIIRTLLKRGADATRAMDYAQRGLAGAYEDDPRLDREGY